MGRMGELADAVSELRRCGEMLVSVSETLAGLFSSEAAEKPKKREEKTKNGKKAGQPEKKEKSLTLEEVRAVLAEKSRAGHTEEVRELLNKHGADKLSEIDPAEYAALLAEAEVL